MEKEKEATQDLQIQPLSGDVLANLSIEELEERLEMQILHLSEPQGCWDCGTECSCNAQCNQCTTNTCDTNNPCNDCGTLNICDTEVPIQI